MKVYAVMRGDGTPKRTRCGGALAVYAGMTVAKRAARCKGDSVIEVEFDLSKRPLYIHGHKMVEGEWSPQ